MAPPRLSMRQVRACSVVVVCVWIVVVWQQWEAVLLLQEQQQQQQQQQAVSTNGTISPDALLWGALAAEVAKYHPAITTAAATTTTQRQHRHDTVTPDAVGDSAGDTDDNAAVNAITAGYYLNGIPVIHHNGPPPASKIDCTHPPFDENVQPNHHQQQQPQLWMLQSCRFETLCWDLQQHDFVLIRPNRIDNDDSYAPCWNQHSSSSSSINNNNTTKCAVALGGINPRWDQGELGLTKGSWKLQWFPRIVSATDDDARSGYFQFPSHVVWSPFHSMAGHNVGHLLWDDFYPLFRLWRRFDVLPHSSSSIKDSQQTQTQILLWRQKLSQQALYATCDIRRNKRMQCKRNFMDFVSLLGVDPSTFSTSKDFQWNVTTAAITTTTTTTSSAATTTSLICAKTGVAGMGLLTDHGLSDHGWEYAMPNNNNNQKANDPPHNLGHGRDLYAFRNFVLENTVGHAKVNAWRAASIASKKRKIVFSLESSKDWDRRLNFTQHQVALQAADLTTSSSSSSSTVEVQAYRLWQLSLQDQLQLAVTTDIFVTVCGGGSMTATFLPRGASLIVFYNPVGGYDFANNVLNHQPARLDWDLLNNAASHLRVHWLPIPKSMLDGTLQITDPEVGLFVELIRHELDILEAL